jgi:hypothetical protein
MVGADAGLQAGAARSALITNTPVCAVGIELFVGTEQGMCWGVEQNGEEGHNTSLKGICCCRS